MTMQGQLPDLSALAEICGSNTGCRNRDGHGSAANRDVLPAHCRSGPFTPEAADLLARLGGAA